MSREETADSIEIAFGAWGAVGQSSHVLDGGPHPKLHPMQEILPDQIVVF